MYERCVRERPRAPEAAHVLVDTFAHMHVAGIVATTFQGFAATTAISL
jgi:hypothetical protein